MMRHGSRDIPCLPSLQPGSHTQVRVIAECEEGVIKSSGIFHESPVIHGGASIRAVHTFDGPDMEFSLFRKFVDEGRAFLRFISLDGPGETNE